jgi:hypothetical protein
LRARHVAKHRGGGESGRARDHERNRRERDAPSTPNHAVLKRESEGDAENEPTADGEPSRPHRARERREVRLVRGADRRREQPERRYAETLQRHERRDHAHGGAQHARGPDQCGRRPRFLLGETPREPVADEQRERGIAREQIDGTLRAGERIEDECRCGPDERERAGFVE